jgi:hypothetical protein
VRACAKRKTFGALGSLCFHDFILGYKDHATALIAEPQLGGLTICLVDDRILQIRAGIATPGNTDDVGVNWRQQAPDTLVSSPLPDPPSRRAIPPSIALDAASHAKSSSPITTVLSRCVIPSPESSISAYRREAFVTAIIGIFV